MRNRFCVLILTNNRPDRVHTVKTLNKHGYTGAWFLVIDDEDPTANEYKKKFGEERVVIFNKREIAERFDEADNFDDRRSIFYARNASFDLAKLLGYQYFVQLDDDYDSFRWRISPEIEYSSKMLANSLDDVFDAMFDFFISTPRVTTLCMAQSGDFIGGGGSKMCIDQFRRKAMNSFFCDTERRFEFQGKVNEDVNTYTSLASRGVLMLTTAFVSLNQKTTQQSPGGMSGLYRDSGTYIKTFYSVMIHPSGVKISVLFNTSAVRKLSPKTNKQVRIHHRVSWINTAPMILRENIKKS